jgi:AcrR family transcriptional regulator
MSDKKRENQSEKILLSALDCISTKGYANTSMRDIAEEAGVALSQLNYHYKNKEGLFLEVIDMTLQKYLQEIDSHIMLGKSPKERMVNLLRYFRETLGKNQKLFRILYDFTSLALWSPVFEGRLNLLFNNITELIDKHILLENYLTNKIKKYSSKTIASMLSGAMFGTAIQVILKPDDKDFLDALDAIELVFE